MRPDGSRCHHAAPAIPLALSPNTHVFPYLPSPLLSFLLPCTTPRFQAFLGLRLLPLLYWQSPVVALSSWHCPCPGVLLPTASLCMGKRARLFFYSLMYLVTSLSRTNPLPLGGGKKGTAITSDSPAPQPGKKRAPPAPLATTCGKRLLDRRMRGRTSGQRRLPKRSALDIQRARGKS